MSEVCWMHWHHVSANTGLHVDYFNVFFIIYYFQLNVNGHIGVVRSLSDATTSCVGECKITCGLFYCVFYFKLDVNGHIGDVRGLSDAPTSCIGKCKFTCGLI